MQKTKDLENQYTVRPTPHHLTSPPPSPLSPFSLFHIPIFILLQKQIADFSTQSNKTLAEKTAYVAATKAQVEKNLGTLRTQLHDVEVVYLRTREVGRDGERERLEMRER
jgi:hypothetical protein